jgi:hypothetical protein
MLSIAFFSGEDRLETVVTDDFKTPDAFNTQPLESIAAGRGSLTFFNPGTVMAPLTTGRRVIGDGGSTAFPSIASKVFPRVNVPVSVAS